MLSYPFELRGRGNRVRLCATVEIMTNDGGQVETEAPVGYIPPSVYSWTDPSGERPPLRRRFSVGPEGVDGAWAVEVELREEMMQVNIEAVGV